MDARLAATGSVRWLPTGEAAFQALLAAIETARRTICLQIYIFAAGSVGDHVRDQLVRAQQRGVRVQVLLDSLGSFELPTAYWSGLVEAGGEFRWFNPLSLRRFTYRDHRKIIVCDEETAFVGGCNIAKEYTGDGIKDGWRDLAVEVHGPLARALGTAFGAQFDRADALHQRFARWRRQPPGQLLTTPDGDVLLGGPGRRHNVIKTAIRAEIRSSQCIDIISAYFLPSWNFRRALARRARSGARVRLILAGKSDVPLAQLAGRRTYQSLLRSGVEIFEYQPQVLHAKLYAFDRAVYVGSANFDIRSMNINYEVLLRLTDPRILEGAKTIFEQDLGHCRRIAPDTWPRARSFWVKLKERLAYIVLARYDQYLAQRQLRWLR